MAIDAAGALGDFELKILGSLAQPAKFDGVDLKFALDGPSLDEIGEAFGIVGLPDHPYEASGELKRSGTALGLYGGRLTVGESLLSIEAMLPAFPRRAGAY